MTIQANKSMFSSESLTFSLSLDTTAAIDYTEIMIYKNVPEGRLPIAAVIWDETAKTTYIKTVGTRLQDCIVTWEDFTNFIKLVDEADYQISKSKQNKTA